jgi:hypothetical protein
MCFSKPQEDDMKRIYYWLFGFGLLCSLLAGVWLRAAKACMGVYCSQYLVLANDDSWKWTASVAYSPQHDDYMVVWETWLPGSNHHLINGRRVGSDGTLYQAFVVYDDTYNSLQPAIAYDGVHDRYLVVWSYDSTGDGTDDDIYGRFIPWNGPSLSEPAFAIDSDRTNADKPRVAYSSTADEFMIVWKVEDDPPYIAGGIIYHDKSGKALGAISTDGLVDDFPDVAYNQASGDFLTVWDVDVTRTTYDLDIYGVRLNWEGLPQYPGEFPIATLIDVEEHPTVAACYNYNQFFVAWQRKVDPVKPDWNIYGRFMTGTGFLGPIYGYAGTTSPQRNARLTCNPYGTKYLLTWDDMYAQPLSRIGVWAEIINPNGIVEPAFEVVRPSDTKDRVNPAVAFGKLNTLIVWQHQREASTYYDIWGQLIWPYRANLPLIKK